MAKIVTIPNSILRQKASLVEINDQTVALIKELKVTVINREGSVTGVGLAAVQIGVPKKVFLAYSKKSSKFLTFINAEITWYSKSTTTGIPESKNRFEGCLSVPNKWALVRRSKKIKISYQSETGTWQKRTFSGQLATIIQHEYDHTNGILFIDRALEQGGKIYELTKDEEGKEYLKEIKLP